MDEARELALLNEQIAEYERRMAEAKALNPFWYYEPSDGSLSEDGLALLREYLEEGDIPQVLDGQRDVHESTAEITLHAGGNQGGKCLTFQALIDTPDGEVAIGKLFEKQEPFDVYAWDGNKKVVARASAPFKKNGLHQCYRIVMSDGRVIDAADHHRVLMNDDNYTNVDELLLFFGGLQGSNSEFCPSVHGVNERHCEEIGSDCINRCSGRSRQYGERLPFCEENDRSELLSKADVRERNFLSCDLDDSESKYSGIPYMFLPHLSSRGEEGRSGDRSAEFLDSVAYTIFQQSICKHRESLPLLSGSIVGFRLSPSGVQGPFFDYDFFSCFSPLYCDGNQIESITPITACQEVYDFEVEKYHNYCAGGLVHHNSTAGAISAFIWATGEVPLSMEGWYPREMVPVKFPQHVRVESVDWATLQKNVLPIYQKWVPREYLAGGSWSNSYSAEERTLKLGKKNVLRGTVEFMTNQQDTESHQGPPRHAMIYDEEPKYAIYKENLMRFTTADRIKILFCMTPTKGMSWVHEEIVLKSEDAAGNRIKCFQVPSITNKLANLKIIRSILGGLSNYQERKMRLLGEFVSLSGLVYGKLFSDKLHVIKPFPITHDDFTVYRGLDPHLVKPTVCVEVAIDREGIEYVIGCYSRDGDTEEIKEDLAERAARNGYRLGWTMCDKSADTTIKVLGDRNVYLELKRGKNAIPALFKSDKFTGSIHAGVDTIKKLLKVDNDNPVPKLFFFDIPENRLIINAMKTLERDRALNEEDKGVRDKIKEGKHDAHACLRYMHQRPMRWLPARESVPEYQPVNKVVNY